MSRFNLLKALLDTPDTPRLGPRPRDGVLPVGEVMIQTEELLEQSNLTGEPAELVRSLVLLWHDQLDASHQISQSILSADGSYLHGLMHRREPDFGNAAYWFRRVGDHPVYPQLTLAVKALKGTSPFTERLLRDGDWNPSAMIDACEAVEVGAADATDESFLREVQSLEFHLLLRRFCDM